MGKPNDSAQVQKSHPKKDLKPRFIRPIHVMPVGAHQACKIIFPQPTSPPFAVISAK